MTDANTEETRNKPKNSEEDWDIEDCSYLLRTLERNAFSTVVAALRAQGPPSEHTFTLIDHLKSALFINDELYRAEVRRATYDQKLTKIASKLNPSYDTFTDWAVISVEARGAIETAPPRAKPFNKSTTISVADRLLALATEHNNRVDDTSARAFELLKLPTRAFVPERLRQLLRETERVVSERVLLPSESIVPVVVPPPPIEVPDTRPPPAKRRRGRQNKNAVAAAERALPPPELIAEKTKDELVHHGSLFQREGSLQPLAPDSLHGMPLTATPSSVHAVVPHNYDPSTSGTQHRGNDLTIERLMEIERQEQIKLDDELGAGGAGSSGTVSATVSDESKKRRRPKPAFSPDLSLANTSARTRPFRFKAGEPGQPKPPRGNPDKRSAKRTSPGFGGNLLSPSVGSSNATTPLSARPQDVSPLYNVRGVDDDQMQGGSGRNGLMVPSGGVYGSGGSTVTTPVYGSGSTVPQATSNVVLSRPLSSGVSLPSGNSSGHVVKRSPYAVNAARQPQAKYYVNPGASGGGASSSYSSSSVLNTPTTSRLPVGAGLASRTSSLVAGSQQMSSIQQGPKSGVCTIVSNGHLSASGHAGPSTSTTSQHSSASASSTSLSGGASASSSSTSHHVMAAEPALPISALPPEEYGHDYGVTMSDPSVSGQSTSGGYSGSVAVQQQSTSSNVFHHGQQWPPQHTFINAMPVQSSARMTPRSSSTVRPRSSIQRPIQLNNPNGSSSTSAVSTVPPVTVSPSTNVNPAMTMGGSGGQSQSQQQQQQPQQMLQRSSGSMSSSSSSGRGRTVSRIPSTSSGLGAPVEGMSARTSNEEATEERVKATVHSIKIDAERLERANGKRMNIHQSRDREAGGSTISSPQSHHSSMPLTPQPKPTPPQQRVVQQHQSDQRQPQQVHQQSSQQQQLQYQQRLQYEQRLQQLAEQLHHGQQVQHAISTTPMTSPSTSSNTQVQPQQRVTVLPVQQQSIRASAGGSSTSDSPSTAHTLDSVQAAISATLAAAAAASGSSYNEASDASTATTTVDRTPLLRTVLNLPISQDGADSFKHLTLRHVAEASTAAQRGVPPIPLIVPNQPPVQAPPPFASSSVDGASVSSSDRSSIVQSQPLPSSTTARPDSPPRTVPAQLQFPIQQQVLDPAALERLFQKTSSSSSSSLFSPLFNVMSPSTSTSTTQPPRPPSNEQHLQQEHQRLPSSNRPIISQQPQQQPRAPRQFVLQPAGSSYSEFCLENPLSYRSFAADGTPTQYGVDPEELHDHSSASSRRTESSSSQLHSPLQLSYAGLPYPHHQLSSTSASSSSTSTAATNPMMEHQQRVEDAGNELSDILAKSCQELNR